MTAAFGTTVVLFFEFVLFCNNSFQILFYFRNKVFRILYLLFNVLFCNYVKVFIIAIRTDLKRILNNIAQSGFKNTGFNIFLSEICNYAGMLSEILSGKC